MSDGERRVYWAPPRGGVWVPIWLLARIVFRLTLLPVGRFRVAGRRRIPREGGVLVVANHLADLDPVFVGMACIPRRGQYIALAKHFTRWPLARALFGLGAFPVRPGGSDARALRYARNQLAAGRLVVIFPEGVRAGARTWASSGRGWGCWALWRASAWCRPPSGGPTASSGDGGRWGGGRCSWRSGIRFRSPPRGRGASAPSSSPAARGRRCARCSSRWCARARDRPRSAPAARPVGAARELRPRGRARGLGHKRHPGAVRWAAGAARAGGTGAAAGVAGRARGRRAGSRAGHRARRLPLVGDGERARAAPLRAAARAHPGVRRPPPAGRHRSPGGRDARDLGGLRAAPAHRLRRLVQRRRAVPGGQHPEGRDPGGRGAAGARRPPRAGARPHDHRLRRRGRQLRARGSGGRLDRCRSRRRHGHPGRPRADPVAGAPRIPARQPAAADDRDQRQPRPVHQLHHHPVRAGAADGGGAPRRRRPGRGRAAGHRGPRRARGPARAPARRARPHQAGRGPPGIRAARAQDRLQRAGEARRGDRLPAQRPGGRRGDDLERLGRGGLLGRPVHRRRRPGRPGAAGRRGVVRRTSLPR